MKKHDDHLIRELESFLCSHSDGEWEHSNGISIMTLDNPGWSVIVQLDDTELADQNFESFAQDRSEHDWIRCRVKDGKFEGFGGPRNLSEILMKFLSWAGKASSVIEE